MPTTFQELAGIGTGVSVGGLVLASEIRNMATGGMYSLGMEMIGGYKNAPVIGAGQMYQLGNMFVNFDPRDPLATQINLPSNVLSLTEDAMRGSPTGRTLTNTAVPGSALFPVLNIGFTALTGMQRYSEGGGAELGRFLIEDAYAQLYGNRASQMITTITADNAGRISNVMGVDKGTIDTFAREGRSIQQYRTILGSTLLGRMMPVLGGYTGANLGFGVGQSIGEGLGNMLFDGSYGLGLAGGIMGAKVGAMVGAAATKSGVGLALSAAAIGGTMIATEVVGDILKTGFKQTRNRGLDFAGDLSAYNTNSAVTMRQRAVQSMHKSHLNARSALGQEASFQHMNRDYFAHYRRF